MCLWHVLKYVCLVETKNIYLMKSLTSCFRENIRESHKTLEELETVHNKYMKRQEVSRTWLLYCINKCLQEPINIVGI